jgi:hypothetical protein
MKNLALASFVAVIFAQAAFALPYLHLLSPADMQEIQWRVPGADLTNLTSEQAAALAAALHGSDSGVGAEIRAILK